MNEQKLLRAEKHVRNAWVAGLITAGVTFAMSFIGAYSEAFRHKYGFDTWTLIDVAIILGFTFGIFRKSRFCALSMLIYLLISKIALAAETGRFAHGIGALIFGYFFFQGTIATFQLHKSAIESGQVVKKKHGPLMYIALGAVSLVTLAVVALIIFGALGPGTEVVPDRQLKAKYANTIRELRLLDTGEEVLFWYSDALLDFTKGFYFFTNKKVVVYSSEFENPAIIVPYSDILEINLKRNPSFFEDSQITLFLNDGTLVSFPVSSDNVGDRKFYDLLLSTWQKKRGN